MTPLLNDTVKLNGDEPAPLRGYPPGSEPLKSLRIAEGNGRTLQAGDSGGVLLGKFLAKNLGKKVGDTVNIETKDFKVLGIYDAPSTYEDRGAAALLAELQTLMDRPKQVSEFDLSFKPEFRGDQAAVERVQAAVRELRGPNGKRYGLDALTTDPFVNGSNEIRLSPAMAWKPSSLALIIGAVGKLNTMIMSVLERTQEIGILRAIGWRKRRIMRMILGESFALCLAGALAGMAGRAGANEIGQPHAGGGRVCSARHFAAGNCHWVFAFLAGRIGRGRVSGISRGEFGADGGFAL